MLCRTNQHARVVCFLPDKYHLRQYPYNTYYSLLNIIARVNMQYFHCLHAIMLLCDAYNAVACIIRQQR